MTSADLKAEFEAAVDRVRQSHLDRLQALNVTPAAIAHLNLSGPAFGVVNADPDRDGLYQPGEGPLHLVMPVHEGGGLVDLVAWRSDDPTRWWLRTGLGWLLNADACIASRWDGDHLTLHATPLDWLRAGEGGAWEAGGVVLDFDAPDLRALRCFDTITCATDWLAATLRRSLAKPARMPTISIMEARHAA